jgi:hypothetical protein
MYSTVNVPLVARDLARLPHGAAVAGVLLDVLALDVRGLRRLDALARTDDQRATRAAQRELLLEHVRAQAPALEVLARTRTAARSAGLDAWLAAGESLDQAAVGGYADLARWVHDELLDWAWERSGELAVHQAPAARHVIDDALLAAWTGGDRLELAAPWQSFVADRPAAAVDSTAVAAVVELVAAADRAAFDRAALALLDARRTGWSWAAAMHDACWAVELTGRGRSAVIAQLRAVRAMRRAAPAGVRPDAAAAIVAAVHATLVRDVLDEATVSALRRPFEAMAG